jgi:uncharacterized protein YkwD
MGAVWTVVLPDPVNNPNEFEKGKPPMTRVILTSFALAVLVLPPLTLADEKKDELKLSEDEQALLDLTNAERKKADLPPLTANPKLFEAARGHAANMAKQDKLEHTLDGKTLADRLTAVGYKASRGGENIAGKQRAPRDAVTSWMNSPPHKENMLNKNFTEVGLAVAKNANGDRYWVQVFGAPPP